MSVEPMIPLEAARCDDFATLDSCYRRRLTHYLRRYYRHDSDLDIEEAVQETLCRAFERFGQFEPGRDPWPWLLVVAKNILNDALREQTRHPVEPAPTTISLEDAALAEVVTREDAAALKQVIAELPTAQRMVLTLRLIDEWSFEAIAEFTETSENCVRQHLHRARAFVAARWLNREGRELALLLPVASAPALRWWRRLGSSRSIQPAAGVLIAGTVALGGLAVVTADTDDPTGVVTRIATDAEQRRSALVGSSVPGTPTAASSRTAITPAAGATPPPDTATITTDLTDPPLARGARHSVVVKIPTPVGTVAVEFRDENADRAGPVCGLGVVDCG